MAVASLVGVLASFLTSRSGISTFWPGTGADSACYLVSGGGNSKAGGLGGGLARVQGKGSFLFFWPSLSYLAAG